MSVKAERSKELTKLLGTRNVYGEVLAELGEKFKNIVALNADLSGSTKTDIFHKPGTIAPQPVCQVRFHIL